LKKLLEHQQILVRIDQLASQIDSDFEGRRLIVVPVLWGACTFSMELFNRLKTTVTILPIWATSYSGTSQGNLSIKHDWDLSQIDPAACSALIVDDILDSGKTINGVVSLLKGSGFHDTRTCFLLDKEKSSRCPNYTGFVIPDKFVVGFGLDMGGRYRGLPDICIIEECKGQDERS